MKPLNNVKFKTKDFYSRKFVRGYSLHSILTNMRSFLFSFSVITLLFFSYGFISPNVEKVNTSAVFEKNVKWYTWEEAIELNKKVPKKMFIDVYTDWCGWCKKMDKATFEHPDVSNYMNEHFYPVKLDAEMKREVIYNDHTFKFVQAGRRGVHELAVALLNNKMSYPSCVAMDEDVNRITIIPGYRDAPDMLSILKYIKLEKYKEMGFQEYLKSTK